LVLIFFLLLFIQKAFVAIILPNIDPRLLWSNSSIFISKCRFGSFLPVFLSLASFSLVFPSSSKNHAKSLALTYHLLILFSEFFHFINGFLVIFRILIRTRKLETVSPTLFIKILQHPLFQIVALEFYVYRVIIFVKASNKCFKAWFLEMALI
jgi:hypothetical protein